jgi:hypothetical protein
LSKMRRRAHRFLMRNNVSHIKKSLSSILGKNRFKASSAV